VKKYITKLRSKQLGRASDAADLEWSVSILQTHPPPSVRVWAEDLLAGHNLNLHVDDNATIRRYAEQMSRNDRADEVKYVTLAVEVIRRLDGTSKSLQEETPSNPPAQHEPLAHDPDDNDFLLMGLNTAATTAVAEEPQNSGGFDPEKAGTFLPDSGPEPGVAPQGEGVGDQGVVVDAVSEDPSNLITF